MDEEKQELKRITFLVDEDTYEALRAKAYNEHVGMSKLIREGLPLIINAPVAQPKHGGPRTKAATVKNPPKAEKAELTYGAPEE